MLPQRHGDRGLVGDRPRAQCRAGDGEPPLHDRLDVQLGLHAVERRDFHQPPFERERVDVARKVVAADHVQHDVDAASRGQLADHGDKVGLAVVDGALGAEPLARRALLGRPGGREYSRPARLRQLNRGRADAARPAVHQDRFARLQASPLEDVRPDGEERLRNRRRRDQIHAARDRQTLRRRRRTKLRVAASRHERAHRVAHAPVVHVGAERHDGARDLETGNIGRAGRRRISAAPLEHVGPVDTRRGDLDQHLARRRSRLRPFRRDKHLGFAGLTDLDGNHGCVSSPPNRWQNRLLLTSNF